MLSHIVKFLFLIMLCTMITSCGDDNNPPEHLIPNVYVNFYLHPDGIDFIPAGGWRSYDEEGYRGIIIYRVDQFVFNAYERACPYDPQKECAQVEVSGIILVDSCCMSQFSILDGMPAGGPSTLPLKQYFTEYDYEGAILHVYNSP